MRIVLSTPPSEGKSWSTVPPIGLSYVAGSVSSLQGIEVRVVDAMSEEMSTEEAVERILGYSPDLVGVSVMSASIERGSKLIKAIKKARPQILTISGGYHATAFDNLLLQEISELDLVLRGEVDKSFPLLCQRLLANEDISDIPGLSFRRNGKIIRGEPQYIEDLDSIPNADLSVLDFDGYWQNFAGVLLPKLPRLATLVSSRGCPHKCTFCSKLTPGSKKYRTRSAENVFQEILTLADKGYEVIFFTDENFTHNVQRVVQICELILSHNLNLRFIFEGTLHNLSQPVLDLMHKAGFDACIVGVESGSDAQLKRYKKSGNRTLLAEGIRRAKKANMYVHGFFMCGAPDETAADCKASHDFLRRVRPHSAGIAELQVFPGSALWDELINPVSTITTLENSRCQNIHSLTGQVDKDVINQRIRDFNKAFIRSWLSWKRLPEVIALLRHNPTIRSVITGLWRLPKKRRRAFLMNLLGQLLGKKCSG